MQGKRIGYIRISTFDQNPARQLEQTHVDRVFTDKASGKDANRPQLEFLLAFVREGDTVVVHSMDRLARTDDLRRLVQGLTKIGVRVEFVKEGLVFNGDDSMATLRRSVMEPLGVRALPSAGTTTGAGSLLPSSGELTVGERRHYPTHRPHTYDNEQEPGSKRHSWRESSGSAEKRSISISALRDDFLDLQFP